MNILLTGANGFLGKSISSHFESSNIHITPFQGDILKLDDLKKSIFTQNYDVIIHLAAISSPLACEKDKLKALETNTNSLIDICNVLKESNYDGVFLFFSSAHVYGMIESDCIEESTTLLPKTTYGASKASAEKVLKRFSTDAKYNTIIFRVFNIAHESQNENFFIPYIISALKKAKKNGEKHISTGNINVERDFTSLPTFLRNFENIINSNLKTLNKFEIFNLGSGKKRKLIDIFTLINNKLNANVTFKIDKSRFRENDPIVQVGSQTKLKTHFNILSETDYEFVENLFSK